MQFEFMIESILYARDAWLKEDGVIWPTMAALHLVPCSADKDYRSKVLFWDNAYEFNLSALKSLAVKEFFSKPKYNHVLRPEDCLSEPCTLLQLDMRTVQIPDLEVRKGDSVLTFNNRWPRDPQTRAWLTIVSFRERQRYER
ncbi:Protein arginine N-methyltransferase 2 [Saguinus oedipus]|uniref:Protein arginine N-methyltransferase 2 n=1 Tax=Saguinus oedipus TaxID=9490 RepID=A0ABQ9TZT6_SAGOE|nr:Protein arginine N-methyltransferase 2 [Saguinus oedipus]